MTLNIFNVETECYNYTVTLMFLAKKQRLIKMNKEKYNISDLFIQYINGKFDVHVRVNASRDTP